MPDLRTSEETVRSPIDGTEMVRLQTDAANWKASLADIFSSLGGDGVGLDSPHFTGVPTAPTAAPNTNDTQLATTAYANAIEALLNAAIALKADLSALAAKANLASPALTGVPTAPTASAGNNSTQLATTAYANAIETLLVAAIALKANLASPTFTGTPAAPTPSPGDNSTKLATTAYADAIAALKANLASPTFTGTPAAPTAAVDTNTTQIATTAMVIAQAASANPLVNGTVAVGSSTRYARGDHVHPIDTTRAPLDNPTFTGVINGPILQVTPPSFIRRPMIPPD